MKRLVSFISILVLLALLWASLSSSIHADLSIRKQWSAAAIGQDGRSLWEQRLEGMRDDLPKQGIVGYVSEQDIPGAPYDAIDSNEEYALTQYFLAPLIVQRGAGYDYVIGNFSDPNYNYQVEKTLGIEQLASYGMGIFLYRGQPK
jgi:hypothetical protein